MPSPSPSQPAKTSRRRTAVAPETVTLATLAAAQAVAEETAHPLLVATVARGLDCEVQALNNALMDTFRALKSVSAYTLLFELNARPFSLVAARIMRMTGSRADPNDILQEAFLAVYRYPTRFCPDKPNAFRNWSYSIIRNTVYRSLNKDSREGVPAEMLADVLADTSMSTPLEATARDEADIACRKVYGVFLALYMQAYHGELKDRDRLALQLVEVQKLGYRDAAERLDIRLENFKMVVCRARKKIIQYMVRVLGTRQQ